MGYDQPWDLNDETHYNVFGRLGTGIHSMISTGTRLITSLVMPCNYQNADNTYTRTFTC